MTVRKVLLLHGVRFLRDVAGYAAGGLTQPTGTSSGYGYGKNALSKLNPAHGEQN